jgi:hypothetical protein
MPAVRFAKTFLTPGICSGPVEHQHHGAHNVQHLGDEVALFFELFLGFAALRHIARDRQERDDLVLFIAERHGVGFEPELSPL